MINIKVLFRWVCALSFVLLLTTAVVSGYWYVFDKDELGNMHKVYLLAQGQKPFVHFFTIYSPLFHYLLIPTSKIAGWTLETLYNARITMIALFLIRLLLLFGLAKTLFNKNIAILTLIFYLFDPFTIFTSMQIRPDNLMVLFSIASFWLLAIRSSFWSGVLMGLSIATLVKIVPAAAVTFLMLIYWRRQEVCAYAFGLILAIVLLSIPFAVNGTLPIMMQNTIFDARLTNETLLYPVRLGNFYWAPNIYIFGLDGRPIVWAYVWILPILGFIGASRLAKEKNDIAKLLTGVLVIQWVLLFFVKSVFIQYYLPITWLFALFGAYVLNDAFNKRYSTLLLILTVTFFTLGSVQANLGRAKLTTQAQGVEEKLLRRWGQIPQNAEVFPNFVFRPSPYPLLYGAFYGDMPKSILNRFLPVEKVLEEKRVLYVLASESDLTYYSFQTEQYIQSSYQRVSGDEELWVRK